MSSAAGASSRRPPTSSIASTVEPSGKVTTARTAGQATPPRLASSQAGDASSSPRC